MKDERRLRQHGHGFAVFAPDAFGELQPVLNERGEIDVRTVAEIRSVSIVGRILRSVTRAWGDRPERDQRAEWKKPPWANMKRAGVAQRREPPRSGYYQSQHGGRGARFHLWMGD